MSAERRALAVPVRPPVAPNERTLIRRFGAPRAAGATLFVWREMLEALLEASSVRTEGYQAALLVGGPFMGPLGPYVELHGFCDFAAHADPLAFANELDADWTQIHNRVRRTHAPHRIVGWVHIERGTGGNLPPLARMVHRTLFHLPFTVVASLDPEQGGFAFYGATPAGDLQPIGFNLVSRPSAAPLPPVVPLSPETST